MVKQLTQTNSLDLNIFTLLQRLNKAVKKNKKKKTFCDVMNYHVSLF